MDSPNVPLLKSRTNFLKVSELYSQLIPPPFLSLTQDFFNHYDVTGKPNWDYLMSEFHFFPSIHVGDPTDPFYEFIFELLCELKCKESSVLDFCLHQYLRDRLMSYGFRGFAETAHLDRSEPYRKHITVPLADLTIKYNNMVNDMCPFLLHDYQSYRHFVRFGLNIDVDKALRFYFMMDVIRTLKGHNEMPLMAMGEWTENFYALMRLMDKVPSNDFCDRRFALAMLIIDSLNQRYHIYSEESIRSLQLFFRAITDAYLPLDEMNRWSCIYPAYINSKKTYAEGRRISKDKCVENPTCQEIRDVLDAASFQIGVENKLYTRELNKDSVVFRGRVRYQFKNDDGTLVNPKFNTKREVMVYVAEMIPKLKSRTQNKGSSEQAQNVQAAKKGSKKKRR